MQFIELHRFAVVELEGFVPCAPNALISTSCNWLTVVCSEFATYISLSSHSRLLHDPKGSKVIAKLILFSMTLSPNVRFNPPYAEC